MTQQKGNMSKLETNVPCKRAPGMMQLVPGVIVYQNKWKNGEELIDVKPELPASSLDVLKAECGRYAPVLDSVKAGDFLTVDSNIFSIDPQTIADNNKHLYKLCLALDIMGVYWRQIYTVSDSVTELYKHHLIENVPSNTRYIRQTPKNSCIFDRDTLVKDNLTVVITNYYILKPGE
jgi:hypothetical protein